MKWHSRERTSVSFVYFLSRLHTSPPVTSVILVFPLSASLDHTHLISMKCHDISISSLGYDMNPIFDIFLLLNLIIRSEADFVVLRCAEIMQIGLHTFECKFDHHLHVKC